MRPEYRPSPALLPNSEEFRADGDAAVRLVAEYFTSLPERPVFPVVSPETIRASLDPSLPVEGREFTAILASIRDVIIAGSRHNGHPRFFGYVSPPAIPAAALADFLASALNSNVTSWRSAPAGTQIERLAVDWVKEIVGFPATATGLLVSGGSMANLNALAAAREAKLPGIRSAGCLALGRQLRAYASDQVHFSVGKALALLGIGLDSLRTTPADDLQRLDLVAVERQIAEDRAVGHIPFCLVASLGSVGTGAVDDLGGAADLAARHGLWLHVDASYGGFAALAASQRHHFRDLGRADSVALDPHKWLYVPVDCGCVLYRDASPAYAAFAEQADYTRITESDPDEAFAFWDYGLELSRRFRALKVWVALSHAGTRALGDAVERNIACAEHLAGSVQRSNDFQLMATGLSIVCFRYRPASDASDCELDALNEEIMIRVQKGGSSYLSGAKVGGRFTLRACVLNYRTTETDVDALLDDCRCAGVALAKVDKWRSPSKPARSRK